MRTMYIILSWVGWGWLVVVTPVIIRAMRRQRLPTPSDAEEQSRP